MPERRLVVRWRPGAARRQPAVLGHRQRNRGRLVHYSGAGLLGNAGLRQAVLFCLRLPAFIGTEEGASPTSTKLRSMWGSTGGPSPAARSPGRAVGPCCASAGSSQPSAAGSTGCMSGSARVRCLPVEFDVTDLLHPGAEHAGRGSAGVFRRRLPRGPGSCGTWPASTVT